jgi:hypothetical protein
VSLLRRVSRPAWIVAALILLTATQVVVFRYSTWYLAVDQYGYLTFADDLLAGRIYHEWKPLDFLGRTFINRTDALAQTYIYDSGRLYCRYSPGFPIVLAVTMGVFGADASHYVNPVVYALLLILAFAFQRRVFGSPWRALVGTALIVLFPTFMHLWALTLTRDLAAHTAGLAGLFLLLPAGIRPLGAGRTAGAFLALGFAVAIRPDAILYLAPGSLMLAARWWAIRGRPGGSRRILQTALGGGLGLLVGLAPFLAYNWYITGNPLRATQAMELDGFFPSDGGQPAADETKVGYPSGAWQGGTLTPVQGGGLRLNHFGRVFPQNFRLLRSAYTNVLLGVAAWGAVLALRRRRYLFLAAIPYVVAALVFFSFWSKPDWRYLVGVFVFVPMLMVEGTFGSLDLVRALGRRRPDVARLVALALAGIVAIATGLATPSKGAVLPTLSLLVTIAFVGGMVAAAVAPSRRIGGVLAPLAALVLVGFAVWRADTSVPTRYFQRREMLRARANFAAKVKPKAVVITTETVGRPAENIDYYARDAWALYLTDLRRWGLSVEQAAEILARGGLEPYLLLPHSQPDGEMMLEGLRTRFDVQLVQDIPPESAMDYFVAASFYPNGVRMLLFRLVPRNPPPATR